MQLFKFGRFNIFYIFFYSFFKSFNVVMIFVWCPDFVIGAFKYFVFAVSILIPANIRLDEDVLKKS